ncbi:glycoside hydrolase [Acephala macrosclerotiorum]|nr:glycoside hydrolase [Acephala macrosclerotiorum]
MNLLLIALVEARVFDLLSRITIDDKVSQLVQGDMDIDYLMHNTALGIPALAQSEGIHGFRVENATIFNSPIGYAYSWNPDLVQKMAATVAKEASALGVHQLYAPLGDPARELGYGRVEEIFGEDGYLAGEIVYAYIKGLQGGNVSATVKHFAASASPEKGLNLAPVHGGERELRTAYLPLFKRQIVDRGAYSVNDAGAIDRLCQAFQACQLDPLDKEDVTLFALPAGNDVEMGSRNYSWKTIPSLVKAGKLSIDIVDTAVSRILLAKFAMGLFENPYLGAPASETASLIRTPKHVPPLSNSANIAVIAPMPHGFMNYGDYVANGSQYRGVTPLDGIKAASKGVVTYAKVATASAADVAIVMVGTWSRDQVQLWQEFNATTGDISGGNALADVLFGDVNPSGKLSVGFPYDVGTTPIYYDYLNSGRSVSVSSICLELNISSLRFGYGKSYSTFVYSNIQLSETKVSANDATTVTMQIINTSNRDGTEVVQLYIKERIASASVPNIVLKGFSKVPIAAGKTETVQMPLKCVVEPGGFLILVGSSNADLRLNATLTIV